MQDIQRSIQQLRKNPRSKPETATDAGGYNHS
jgi:hypothetical protein